MKGHPMEYISEATPIVGQSERSLSGIMRGLRSPLTFGLVSCGGVGAFLFTATYLLEGVTRPGYDAWQQPISALSLGPGGWVQQVNFVVFGVLMLLSAVGWYRFLTPLRHANWYALLPGISGLGLIGAGLFSMDPFPGYPPGAALAASTVHGAVHSILAWAIILTLAQGCFSLGAGFVRFPQWRLWAVYSLITGVLILIFWGMFVQYPTGPLAGLVERLSAGSHALWSCVLVATLLFHQRPGADPVKRGRS
jgi:hypothetical protein